MRTYHIVNSSRVPNIKKQGLLTSHRKNVRISKRGVNYVFSDLLEAGYFASEMSWASKKPVSILHLNVNKKDLQQDNNTKAVIGRWHTINKDILPNQIIKVREVDNNFWKGHKKRMDKSFGQTKTIIIRR